MLYSYVYQKAYQDVDWEVAHIYEHAFIHTIRAHLQEHDINPGLVGSINGETFHDTIFLTANFYDKRVADVFKACIIANQSVSDIVTQRSIAEVSVEQNEKITVLNKQLLQEQLQKLVGQAWLNNDDVVTAYVSEVQKELSSPLRYAVNQVAKHMVLVISLDMESSSLEEGILFLRFYAIVSDIVTDILLDNFSCHLTQSYDPNIQDTRLCSTSEYDIGVKTDMAVLQVCIEDGISKVDFTSPLVDAQFDEFAVRPSWKYLVQNYFRDTSILTSNAEIAAYATPENIRDLVSHLRFECRELEPEVDQEPAA